MLTHGSRLRKWSELGTASQEPARPEPSHGPFIWTGSHPQQASLRGAARKSHQFLITVIIIIMFYIKAQKRGQMRVCEPPAGHVLQRCGPVRPADAPLALLAEQTAAFRSRLFVWAQNRRVLVAMGTWVVCLEKSSAKAAFILMRGNHPERLLKEKGGVHYVTAVLYFWKSSSRAGSQSEHSSTVLTQTSDQSQVHFFLY